MPTIKTYATSNQSVGEIIARRALSPRFQPILSFATLDFVGYEGLIRGPAGTALEMPYDLLGQAMREGNSLELECAAARACVDAFHESRLDGKLYLNFSANALTQLAIATGDPLSFMRGSQLSTNRLVVEITEQSVIHDPSHFTIVVKAIRSSGAKLALDDYGIANASLGLWLRLRPDIVKIDRLFSNGITNDPLKFHAVSAMLRFARESNTQIIAEGIEQATDLTVLRDLGIELGQGYLIGRPSTRPPCSLPEEARRALQTQQIAVFPEVPHLTPSTASAGIVSAKMLVHAPPVPLGATNDEVSLIFSRHSELHALAIIQNDRPIALLNRRSFMDQYAKPFHRELFGRRSCMMFANPSPMMVEKNVTAEQMANYLSGNDQCYLADGLIITYNGAYLGLCTGESFIRAVTEVTIEIARYANPLTCLPGNVLISSYITRLLEKNAIFVACYVDLNQFKPLNDHYGYWQGDKVLRFAASILTDTCDPTLDFLGHVGGDDFLVIFQSENWCERVVHTIEKFNKGAQEFYAPKDRATGGIFGEDRRGHNTFFSFVTMAVGCVVIDPGRIRGRLSSETIASLAAFAKRRAKQSSEGIDVVDVDAVQAYLNTSELCTKAGRSTDQTI